MTRCSGAGVWRVCVGGGRRVAAGERWDDEVSEGSVDGKAFYLSSVAYPLKNCKGQDPVSPFCHSSHLPPPLPHTRMAGV